MRQIRRSDERGLTDLGWLHSRHTFSFGQYYDPQHMGLSALRVINDDRVEPGAGFGTHGHRDMEILSYVTDGTIEHKDSMGHTISLPAGEFQLMSAGTGVTHSEYNASDTAPLHFLQIWVMPDQKDLKPGYQQKRFAPTSDMQLIASPDARDGSLLIHQDALLHHIILDAGKELVCPVTSERSFYLHVIRGTMDIDGESFDTGDGLELIEEEAEVVLRGMTAVEALLFDLPAVVASDY
jgi:quercetin 2,3-dioxygenase